MTLRSSAQFSFFHRHRDSTILFEQRRCFSSPLPATRHLQNFFFRGCSLHDTPIMRMSNRCSCGIFYHQMQQRAHKSSNSEGFDRSPQKKLRSSPDEKTRSGNTVPASENETVSSRTYRHQRYTSSGPGRDKRPVPGQARKRREYQNHRNPPLQGNTENISCSCDCRELHQKDKTRHDPDDNYDLPYTIDVEDGNKKGHRNAADDRRISLNILPLQQLKHRIQMRRLLWIFQYQCCYRNYFYTSEADEKGLNIRPSCSHKARVVNFLSWTTHHFLVFLISAIVVIGFALIGHAESLRFQKVNANAAGDAIRSKDAQELETMFRLGRFLLQNNIERRAARILPDKHDANGDATPLQALKFAVRWMASYLPDFAVLNTPFFLTQYNNDSTERVRNTLGGGKNERDNGILLIANECNTDPLFKHSIVLVCDWKGRAEAGWEVRRRTRAFLRLSNNHSDSQNSSGTGWAGSRTIAEKSRQKPNENEHSKSSFAPAPGFCSTDEQISDHFALAEDIHAFGFIINRPLREGDSIAFPEKDDEEKVKAMGGCKRRVIRAGSLPWKTHMPWLVKYALGDNPVMLGGPLGIGDGVRIIHRIPDVPWANPLAPGVYLGGDENYIFRQILNGNAIAHRDIMVVVGYSAWQKGQLESEIAGEKWPQDNDGEKGYSTMVPISLGAACQDNDIDCSTRYQNCKRMWSILTLSLTDDLATNKRSRDYLVAEQMDREARKESLSGHSYGTKNIIRKQQGKLSIKESSDLPLPTYEISEQQSPTDEVAAAVHNVVPLPSNREGDSEISNDNSKQSTLVKARAAQNELLHTRWSPSQRAAQNNISSFVLAGNTAVTIRDTKRGNATNTTGQNQDQGQNDEAPPDLASDTACSSSFELTEISAYRNFSADWKQGARALSSSKPRMRVHHDNLDDNQSPHRSAVSNQLTSMRISGINLKASSRNIPSPKQEPNIDVCQFDSGVGTGSFIDNFSDSWKNRAASHSLRREDLIFWARRPYFAFFDRTIAMKPTTKDNVTSPTDLTDGYTFHVWDSTMKCLRHSLLQPTVEKLAEAKEDRCSKTQEPIRDSCFHEIQRIEDFHRQMKL